MTLQTAGIHHITAYAQDPQRNVDFYTGVLGLRMVKRTVNYDAPEVYHLYFGDESGQPGTIITFFPSSASRRGMHGGGQVGYITFAVPIGALSYWEQRLRGFGVSVMKAFRFNEPYLQFSDRDGLRLELVERDSGSMSGWSVDDITSETAIKGFGGAVLFSSKWKETKEALEQVLGLTFIGEDVNYARYASAGPCGNMIDLPMRDISWGAGGAGTAHHIAWRAKDDMELSEWKEWMKKYGYASTDMMNRNYFKSLYFRERGGILFEIATDVPGFTMDEDLRSLGERLKLPAWLEPERLRIEEGLEPIQIRTLERGK
ncbi:ring-cleaving dioxygenase [Paenibacillus glucanolyticus]|uniref:Ring-cleaving dioxygenase n=1 Tax=Paenibacillus glucanolyticus TaxID=59843 RepID=A0A163HKP1_9BACL|nr:MULTISPECIES: VOC family protein [Paenibacillus]KZS45533.1 ring-cleaving dioxygenase [Paenibacillus glucanolyticus]MDH6673925.1 glyoxalase family protein [Paenibacillus sp. LBL]